jgi:hypothetical protein
MADDDLLLPPSAGKPVTLRDARERSRAIVAKELEAEAQLNFQLQLLVDRVHMSPIRPVGIAAGHLGVGIGDIGRSRLPETYRAAIAKLRECVRLDEVADWSNKLEAMAAYAKTAQNTEVFRLAIRIRARALRRCGEMLKEIPDTNRGRPKIHESDTRITRAAAAEEAGLTPWRKTQALRVVEVPADEFADVVENEHPARIIPTLTARGKRTVAARPRPAPSPVVIETQYILVDHAYSKGLTLDEIAAERQMSTLMAAWRDAGEQVRRRFLQTIGCPDFL